MMSEPLCDEHSEGLFLLRDASISHWEAEAVDRIQDLQEECLRSLLRNLDTERTIRHVGVGCQDW